MLDPEFDPLLVLEDHEHKLNEVINAHNEVARLSENLAETIVRMNTRLEHVEDELNRVYLYIGENISR